MGTGASRSGQVPGPRVFVGVDRSIPGLAALRFAVAEARRLGAPLYAVRVAAQVTLQGAKEIETAFAEALGAPPADVVVHRELLVGQVAETLTRRAHYPTDLLIVGTDGARRRRVFAAASISQTCLRRARCPVLVVPGPEMAEAIAARGGRGGRGGPARAAGQRHPIEDFDFELPIAGS